MIAEEALVLARSVRPMKTIARIKTLYTSLAQSRWKNEPGVARLGAFLLEEREGISYLINPLTRVLVHA